MCSVAEVEKKCLYDHTGESFEMCNFPMFPSGFQHIDKDTSVFLLDHIEHVKSQMHHNSNTNTPMLVIDNQHHNIVMLAIKIQIQEI